MPGTVGAHATPLARVLTPPLLPCRHATQGAPPPPGAPPDELRAQARWRFVDAPLNATLYRCFCYGQSATAERIRVDFKVLIPLLVDA